MVGQSKHSSSTTLSRKHSNDRSATSSSSTLGDSDESTLTLSKSNSGESMEEQALPPTPTAVQVKQRKVDNALDSGSNSVESLNTAEDDENGDENDPSTHSDGDDDDDVDDDEVDEDDEDRTAANETDGVVATTTTTTNASTRNQTTKSSSSPPPPPLSTTATTNSPKSPTSANAVSSDTRKRKAPTISVGLPQFIHLMYEIYDGMEFDTIKKSMRFSRTIQSYVENCSATKYLKFDDNTAATAVGAMNGVGGKITNTQPSSSSSAASSPSIVATVNGSSDKVAAKVYNCVLSKLFAWFESQNATFLFPKELLRYFLATHMKFIKPMDFIETNSIPKADKRGKNTAQLINGSILYEYAKGFDIFVSSMSRSDIGDIQALKFIVQKQMHIPLSMYEPMLNIKFTPKSHIQDTEYTHRADYSQIMITNNKQMFVLITKNIIMIYDGNIFVAPTTNTEREFTVTLRENSNLENGDYMLLDIMFAVKIRVIDVLQCNIKGDTTLPDLYADRLKLIQKMLPDLRLATISTQKPNNDCSYIHKPNKGFGPSYIYHKSNLTVAAIGVIDKNVVLAFHDRADKSLVVKSKVSISGSVSYLLSIMPTTEPINANSSSSEVSTILMDNAPIRIVGDIKDVRLFKHIIPIELKDCSRLSVYSTRPISDVTDYKPNTVRKESAILEDINKQIHLNPDLLPQILLKAATTSIILNDETKSIIRNILEPKFEISFDGYNNLT